MSNKALTWAFSLNLKTGPKFVLVALADYADERNSCYPSYAKIEQKTGIKARAIANHMSTLEELNLVRREELRYDDGRRSGYRFHLNLQILQVAKNDLATCKKRPSHLQNMQDNNHHNNHHNNHQRARGAVFEKMWSDINPNLLKSRQGGKAKAKEVFTRKAKKYGEEKLADAVRSYYSDENTRKDNYKFAPAILVCLRGDKFEGYLGQSQKPTESYASKRIADYLKEMENAR